MQRTKYPQLHDPAWLRRRVAAGATPETLAAELGCGRTTARTALGRFGLLTSDPLRLGEPPPAPLETAAATNGDLDADVADDELERRLREGMRDLAALANLADSASRDAMWDTVVATDAATARSIAFTAAVLASEQRNAA